MQEEGLTVLEVFDPNHDGVVSFDELRTVLSRFAIGLSYESIDALTKQLLGGKESLRTAELLELLDVLAAGAGAAIEWDMAAALPPPPPLPALGHDVAPSELVSERTGTVFVVQDKSLMDKSLEELQKELGNGVLACEKGSFGKKVVVRVDGETAARAARLLNAGAAASRTWRSRCSAALRITSSVPARSDVHCAFIRSASSVESE